MNTVKELQNTLSQLIYSVKDLRSLNEIKLVLDKLVEIKEEKKDILPPWEGAVLSMTSISSFEDVVDSQGNKKLTFDELYPYIDESESDYTVDELLAALN